MTIVYRRPSCSELRFYVPSTMVPKFGRTFFCSKTGYIMGPLLSSTLFSQHASRTMADHKAMSRNPNLPHDSLLEQDLTAYWHFRREERFRLDRRTIWSSYDPNLIVHDHDLTVRFSRQDRLREMWNKPTCFFFEHSASSPCPPRIVFAAIYETWRHGCGEN
jgi:hypothetical protein